MKLVPSSKSALEGESGDGDIGVKSVLWLFPGDGMSSSNGERERGLVVSIPIGLVTRGLRLKKIIKKSIRRNSIGIVCGNKLWL